MQVEQVDERDSAWEDPRPRFRVYLHGSGEGSTHGWTDTYDLTGCDMLQAIDWAQRQAGDRLTYAVALVRDDAERERRNPGCGRGLVWLVGMDGNDTTEESSPARGAAPYAPPPACSGASRGDGPGPAGRSPAALP